MTTSIPSRALTAGLPPSRRALAEHCYAGGFQALAEGDLSAALRWFACLVALEPREERAWVGLGLACERAGRIPNALGVYSLGQLLVTEPSAWLHLGSARTFKALGRPRDAERALDAAESATNDGVLLSAIEEERCLT